MNWSAASSVPLDQFKACVTTRLGVIDGAHVQKQRVKTPPSAPAVKPSAAASYLVEAPVEDPLHPVVVEGDSLDLTAHVFVVEGQRLAGG